MMQDLAMHMLEIIMNSIAAGASLIRILFIDSKAKDEIQIELEDNGKGMSEEMVKRVTDPFTTGRTTRKVGLGVSFMKGLTEQCNGVFDVKSQLGVGTTVYVSLQRSHIDLPPLGNLGEMMMAAIQGNADINYQFTYKNDSNEFAFDTIEVRKELGDEVPLNEPQILLWIRDYINEGIQQAKEEQL
ncbi:MAG: sensor histidine kinase [Solobacterium sp.]|nr:sensor histidine kinase [Solobacterium sp.]